LDSIYIAKPSNLRNTRKRLPNIPESVVIDKEQTKKQEEEELQNMNEDDINELEDKILKEGETFLLEKKIKNNRVKELIEQNGGEGVFFVNDRGITYLFIYL